MGGNSKKPPSRELTRSERAAIRRLVTELCANYDNPDKLCLPFQCGSGLRHLCDLQDWNWFRAWGYGNGSQLYDGPLF